MDLGRETLDIDLELSYALYLIGRLVHNIPRRNNLVLSAGGRAAKAFGGVDAFSI